MKINLLYIVHFFPVVLFLAACGSDPPEAVEPDPEAETGRIRLVFNHVVDGEPVIIDSMMYENAAGNQYEVNEIMYFISDVILYHSDGSETKISEWKDIHYVELEIPSTHTWDVYDKIPAGQYDSITFVFGIPEEKNESFMFVNPPEDKMMWPDILGGGYHYLMINGKWLDENAEDQIYNFHLGIGQLYRGDEINYDSIYAFVQNYFTVKLPDSDFSLQANTTREIEIVMNIESWFETPHNFDFNYWGGAIMEIQPAMRMGVENGHDVFTIGYIR